MYLKRLSLGGPCQNSHQIPAWILLIYKRSTEPTNLGTKLTNIAPIEKPQLTV